MTTLAALQSTLAAEHAAVYLYGVLGGRTSASETPALYTSVSAAYTEHRSRRDVLVSTLTEMDATPVAAEAVYALPREPSTPARVARTAREVEESCAATYAFLVANTAGTQRRWAIGALNGSALRALDFGARPEDFPGT